MPTTLSLLFCFIFILGLLIVYHVCFFALLSHHWKLIAFRFHSCICFSYSIFNILSCFSFGLYICWLICYLWMIEYFQNKLVDTIHFMEILSLKDSVEKDTFFRKLPILAEQLPRQIVLKKVLPNYSICFLVVHGKCLILLSFYSCFLY